MGTMYRTIGPNSERPQPTKSAARSCGGYVGHHKAQLERRYERFLINFLPEDKQPKEVHRLYAGASVCRLCRVETTTIEGRD